MRKAAGILGLLLVLAACGQKADGVPVVRAQPGTNGGVTTFQFEMKVESKFIGQAQAGMGLSGKTPKGLRVAYRFDQGNVVARYDFPALMFPDSKARILLTDQRTGQARLLLADSMSLDQSLPPQMLNDLGRSLVESSNLGFLDPKAPFKKQGLDSFTALSRQAAFDVVERTPTQVVVLRQDAIGEATRKVMLTFDPKVGAVTRSEMSSTSEHNVMKAVSEISYTEVQGMPDTVVPYEIKTKLSNKLVGPKKLGTVELPVASKKFAKNETLRLKPGQTIVNKFTSPPGEGVVDTNKMEMEQTVNYEDIKLNAATPDFFLMGGK